VDTSHRAAPAIPHSSPSFRSSSARSEPRREVAGRRAAGGLVSARRRQRGGRRRRRSPETAHGLPLAVPARADASWATASTRAAAPAVECSRARPEPAEDSGSSRKNVHAPPRSPRASDGWLRHLSHGCTVRQLHPMRAARPLWTEQRVDGLRGPARRRRATGGRPADQGRCVPRRSSS
jgi:hypothetical protein